MNSILEKLIERWNTKVASLQTAPSLSSLRGALVKEAFIGGVVRAGKTLGRAAFGQQGATAAGALSRGLGNTVGQSLSHAGQAFKQQGGLKALGHLGATGAAVGATGYMAGRGMAAGQQR